MCPPLLKSLLVDRVHTIYILRVVALHHVVWQTIVHRLYEPDPQSPRGSYFWMSANYEAIKRVHSLVDSNDWGACEIAKVVESGSPTKMAGLIPSLKT